MKSITEIKDKGKTLPATLEEAEAERNATQALQRLEKAVLVEETDVS